MIQRRHLLSAAALAPIAGSLSAAPRTFVAGKDYLLVNPSLKTSGDKIEVVLFFAYTCPHCLQFEPTFRAWRKKAPSDVSIHICPVAWQPKLLPFTETYFALEALGELDRLHDKFFESVIYQERTYSMENARNDIAAFMVENNVDRVKWEQTVRSFGIQNKSRLATQTWMNYQIDSTPMVGVAGRYTTGAHLVGSREATADCIDFLIDEARRSNRG